MSEEDYRVSSDPLSAPPGSRDASGLRPPGGVSATRGILWIREGLALWRQSPLNFTAMGIIATVLFLVVQMVPLVGALLALIFWPHLSAGLYLAYRRAFEQKPVTITELFRPFQQPGPLATLGGAYLALSVALMVVVFAFMAAQVGGEQLQAWMLPQEGGFDQATMEEAFTRLMGPILLGLVLTVLLLMAFAFAPLLVHQHSKSPFRAIALSFMACLKAFPAMVLFGLGWLGILILANFLALIPVLGGVVLMVLMLALVSFMTGSLYAAYLDLFIRD